MINEDGIVFRLLWSFKTHKDLKNEFDVNLRGLDYRVKNCSCHIFSSAISTLLALNQPTICILTQPIRSKFCPCLVADLFRSLV